MDPQEHIEDVEKSRPTPPPPRGPIYGDSVMGGILKWIGIILLGTAMFFAGNFFQIFLMGKDLSKANKLLNEERVISQQLEKEVNALKKDLERCIEVNDNDPSKRRAQDLEAYIVSQYPGVPKELAEVIATQLDRQCAEQDIPFVLAVGLMEIESRFNPFAKSHVGARGLLQVMPEVWMEELGITDERELNGIEMGTKGGLYVLKKYIEKNNGNITFALKNYNGTKGDEFHTSVYEKAGRFAIFRSRIQNIKQLEVSKKGDDESQKLAVR